MRFDVVTLFPELFGPFLTHGITRRAFESGQVEVALCNPRDFAVGNYRRVDAFISPAHQNRTVAIGPALYRFMIEGRTPRCKQDHWAGLGALCLHMRYALGQGVCHHHHARPTTERAVIDPSIVTHRKIPRIA